MKKAHFVAVVAVPLLALSTSCAFGDRRVALSYPPEHSGGGVTVQGQSSIAPTIVLVDFLDQRPNKLAIGAVHNGFGMHTADVLATNSVPGWVADGIAYELQRAGYRVIRSSSLQNPTENPMIRGEVLTAFCGAWSKYEGDVSFSVRVERMGRELLQKTYTGKVNSSTNWGASGKGFGAALSSALETAAKSFAAELGRDLRPLEMAAPASR